MIPKVIGNDAELGNCIIGNTASDRTYDTAARTLLRQFDGVRDYSAPARRSSVYPYSQIPLAYEYGDDVDEYDDVAPYYRSYYNVQDYGRKYLPSNGGCVYIDMSHLEVCTPEVRSAFDYLRYWKAMLMHVAEKRVAAEETLPAGQQLVVLANNSDGFGNAYGNHLNFSMERAAFDNLIYRKPMHMLFLASYQASSVVLTGQGKVGAENRRPAVPYQLSQRADFFEAMSSLCTTAHRGIVNTRDEALCGNRSHEMARLHCIFYDANLQDVANVLKVGCMQIVLAMLEAGNRVLPLRALLDDPVSACWQWSHDTTLTQTMETVTGDLCTALDIQRHVCDAAQAFVESGGCDGIVPDAAHIVALWRDTLDKLVAGDFGALVGRLDWVLKWAIIERATAQHPDADWSLTAKHLDHQYSRIGDDGLYHAYAQAGAVERLVSDEEVWRAMCAPPDDTRAWGRAHLLRAATDGEITSCDWDKLTAGARTVYLDSPLDFTRAGCAHCFTDGRSLAASVDALMAAYPVAGETRTPQYTERGTRQ